MNLQSQQTDNTLSNNSVEYDITKDPTKRKVIIASRKDIMLNFAHRGINNCTMEVPKVRSLQGCYQKISVIPNPKEAFGEIDE